DGHVTGVQTCALPISAHLELLHLRLLPIPELGRRLVKATGPSHEILDRMGREQLAGRGQGIDAEIFGTADYPALPQRLDGLAIQIGRASCRERVETSA